MAWLGLALLGSWAVISLTAWILAKVYRDPHILRPRRWPEDFWRHSRFNRKKENRHF